jgi:transposase-like protein
MVNKAVRQQDWSLEKRFQAVIETTNMNDEDLGAYCRRHGLHTNTLALWRENCLNALRKSVATDNEKAAIKAELKEVKRDLKRKDKALAEAAARLILQKKASELWGMEAENEEDT